MVPGFFVFVLFWGFFLLGGVGVGLFSFIFEEGGGWEKKKKVSWWWCLCLWWSGIQSMRYHRTNTFYPRTARLTLVHNVSMCVPHAWPCLHFTHCNDGYLYKCGFYLSKWYLLCNVYSKNKTKLFMWKTLKGMNWCSSVYTAKQIFCEHWILITIEY